MLRSFWSLWANWKVTRDSLFPIQNIYFSNSENLWGVLADWGKRKTLLLKSVWPIHRILGAGRDLIEMTISQVPPAIEMAGNLAGPGAIIWEFWSLIHHMAGVSFWVSHAASQHFDFIVCKIRILIGNTYRATCNKVLYIDKAIKSFQQPYCISFLELA